EDSVYEIPVARAIADKAMSLWPEGRDGPPGRPADTALAESIDPYHFLRRETNLLHFGDKVAIGPEQPPAVVVRVPSLEAMPATKQSLSSARLADTPVEGVMAPVGNASELAA